jgi:gluconolactonase
VVAVYDPSGELVEEIRFPEAPANVTFGGSDLEVLFVTARTSLYAVELRTRGALSTNWRAAKPATVP